MWAFVVLLSTPSLTSVYSKAVCYTTNMSKHALEKHRFFPYIAWTLVIGFAFFVYTIVIDLKETSLELSETTARLEMQAKTAPEDLTDFKR